MHFQQYTTLYIPALFQISRDELGIQVKKKRNSKDRRGKERWQEKKEERKKWSVFRGGREVKMVTKVVMTEIDGGGKKGRASWDLHFPWARG